MGGAAPRRAGFFAQAAGTNEERLATVIPAGALFGGARAEHREVRNRSGFREHHSGQCEIALRLEWPPCLKCRDLQAQLGAQKQRLAFDNRTGVERR